jgi:hypothetical protein
MRFYPRLVLLCLLPLAACTKPKGPHDAALATALEELARLKSYTETGVSYHDYADRLVTSKANIDVVLQRSNDLAAKGKVQKAVGFYVAARSAWLMEIENKSSGITPQEYWQEGHHAAQVAAQFAFADEAARRQIDAVDAARESQKAMLRAEAETARRAKEAKEAEVARVKSEKELAQIAADERAIEASKAAKAELEAREAAKAAEEERKRRYAPPGIGFNVVGLSITTPEGVVSVLPASELKITKENGDGNVTFEHGSLTGTMASSDLTNDRDLAEKIRTDFKNAKRIVDDWRKQQNAIAEQMKMEDILRAAADRDEVDRRRREAARPGAVNRLDLPPRPVGGF